MFVFRFFLNYKSFKYLLFKHFLLRMDKHSFKKFWYRFRKETYSIDFSNIYIILSSSSSSSAKFQKKTSINCAKNYLFSFEKCFHRRRILMSSIVYGVVEGYSNWSFDLIEMLRRPPSIKSNSMSEDGRIMCSHKTNLYCRHNRINKIDSRTEHPFYIFVSR